MKCCTCMKFWFLDLAGEIYKLMSIGNSCSGVGGGALLVETTIKLQRYVAVPRHSAVSGSGTKREIDIDVSGTDRHFSTYRKSAAVGT